MIYILYGLMVVVLTMLVIWRASGGFETASEHLGEQLNLTDGVRGATINAIASSLPELFTTLFFLFALTNNGEGFASGIGTTAGSAVFNSFVIPSLVVFVVIGIGLTKKVKVSRSVLFRDGIALILCELVLIFFVSGERLYWYHGLVLMALYGIYLYIMFRLMDRSQRKERETKPQEEEKEIVEKNETVKRLSAKAIARAILTLDLEKLVLGNHPVTNKNSIWLLSLSTLIMGIACWYLVEACQQLGTLWGLEVYFVAVIIAAAATSVPDTVISVRDGMKGNYDDALSNALGSNIFDICFALGLPLFVFSLSNGQVLSEGIPLNGSLEVGEDISILRIILLILTIVAFMIFLIGKHFTRFKATLLAILYLLFVAFVVMKAYDNEIANEIVDFIDRII